MFSLCAARYRSCEVFSSRSIKSELKKRKPLKLEGYRTKRTQLTQNIYSMGENSEKSEDLFKGGVIESVRQRTNENFGST